MRTGQEEDPVAGRVDFERNLAAVSGIFVGIVIGKTEKHIPEIVGHCGVAGVVGAVVKLHHDRRLIRERIGLA